MKRSDIVIVGGGPAGFTTALISRTLYPDKEVTLIRKEEKAMIPCGIPYILACLEGNVDKDILPDAPLVGKGVNIIIDEVKSVDRTDKVVKTASGEEINYEKLVLATGSAPCILKLPGASLKNVFYVYKDYNYLKEFVSAVKEAENIVIVGGGFIGCEFADEIVKLGKKVTIIEALPCCLSLNFDREFCALAENELRKKGTEIIANTKVEKIIGDDKVEAVELTTGQKIPADLVIISVGARPNVELAKGMDLKIGESGAIAVDSYLRTSDPDIFAVGDCAEKIDFFTQRPARIMLASAAVTEARVAAANLYNLSMTRGPPLTFSTKIGDVSLAATGLTESRARDLGFDVVVGYAETVDKHPGALAGARKLKLKLIVGRKCLTILGCEVAGGPSVAELANAAGILITKRTMLCELLSMQVGTHPLLTASPIVYPLMHAAVDAFKKLTSS